MTAPRVSVLTAVRNGEAWLGEAIESVLVQDLPFEHIVVDDGSSDGTADVAARYAGRIRFLRQPATGAAAALNLALAHATAPHQVILDADDLMTPGRLARQCAVLDANPGIEITFGAFREFASGEAAAQATWSVREEVQTGYITGAAMMRRAAVERIGGLNEALVLGWFIDLVMRLRDAGAQEMSTDDLVLLRRIHGANTTIVDRSRRHDYLAVARAAIARRRA